MDTQLKDKLHGIPCAYAIIKNDEDGTIQYANSLFYDLIECTHEDLESRCGMRFSALTNVESFISVKDYINSDTRKPLNIELPLLIDKKNSKWTMSLIQHREQSMYFYIIFINIQDYKNVTETLRLSEEKMYYVFDHTCIDIVEINPKTQIVDYYFSNMYFEGNSINNAKITDIFHDEKIHPDYLITFEACYKKVLEKQIKTGKEQEAACEVLMKNKKAEYVWTKITMIHYFERKKKPYIIIIFTDINAEKEATSNYFEQSLYYQSMLSAQEAYGHIDLTNDTFKNMGGIWNLYNELIGKMTWQDLYTSFIEKVVHPDDRAHYMEVMDCTNIIDSYENGIIRLGCEFRRIVDQNSMTWMRINIHPFKNPLNQHIMALMYLENIDEQKKKTKTSILTEVQYDVLTHLYTKKSSEELISDYLAHMQEDELCAFLLIDVDNMHIINERIGYLEGDTILKYLSDLMSGIFRKRDIIGRYDGDEFIVFFKDIERGRLKKRIQKLYNIISKITDPAFSISGGIVYAQYKDSFMNCMKQASIALYNAKQNPGTFVIFEEDILLVNDMEHDNTEISLFVNKHLKKGVALHTSSMDQSFEELLGTQGEIAYLVNPRTYELIVGNEAFYNRLGITKADCIGKTCYNIIHRRNHPCPFCQKANWTTDKFNMYRNYNIVLEQDFLIKNKLVDWKNNNVLLAYAIDLSNDKSIVDSLETGITEDNYILNGIQNMQKAESCEDIMYHALEIISDFFQSSCVRFWRRKANERDLSFPIVFVNSRGGEVPKELEKLDYDVVNNWIHKHHWLNSINIENQEAMMLESYDMYQYMVRQRIKNSRWFSLQDNDTEIGLIEIDSITANFQNESFMISYITFIINELNQRNLAENIQFNERHDALTGLLNRFSYEEFLASYREDEVSSIAVITADINGLGDINITKGSNTGDYYLKQLSIYLKQVFVNTNIYRLSGDEFQIIACDISVEEVEKKIIEVQDLLDEFDLFTVAIGYAWDSIEKKLSSLAEYATQNMTRYKQLYHNRNNEDNDKHHYLAQNRLIKEIETNRYEVYLQPKIDTKTNMCVGAEALIRFHDEDGSIVPPIQYIPTLEKEGLIRYIDLFVFEEVCKIIERWIKKGGNIPVISLNFSRLTLMENNLTNILETIFSKYQISKKYIEIEITESYANVGKALLYQSAKRIHSAGYAVALDDFGTDYTNLSILSDIHVDVLKIDKSLIHLLTVQTKNQIILKNIIQMCRDLDVEVIAEGVENEEQRDLLMQLNCYLIQGYLYSKPIEVTSFEEQFLNRIVQGV